MPLTPMQPPTTCFPQVPTPAPGPAPSASRPPAVAGDSDRVALPRAQPPAAPPPGPRHIVDGTPEVVLAGLALGGLGLTAGGVELAGGAASLGATLRSAGTYGANLARSVAHSLADPVKAGEHIAEGLIGGAAWAGAAAGVATLADAARAHLAHDSTPPAATRR
jgi:hypothetical protein